jgi:hypothetical protein
MADAVCDVLCAVCAVVHAREVCEADPRDAREPHPVHYNRRDGTCSEYCADKAKAHLIETALVYPTRMQTPRWGCVRLVCCVCRPQKTPMRHHSGHERL